jgi:hypothetical protein
MAFEKAIGIGHKVEIAASCQVVSLHDYNDNDPGFPVNILPISKDVRSGRPQSKGYNNFNNVNYWDQPPWREFKGVRPVRGALGLS